MQKQSSADHANKDAVILREFGRRIFAAATESEVFLAAADVAQRLIGFTECHFQWTQSGSKELELQLGISEQTAGVMAQQPVASNVKTLASEVLKAGPQLLHLTKLTEEPPADLPANSSSRPVSYIIAPIGRSARHAGRMVLQRVGSAPYSPDDLEVAQALANFCSDAVARVRAEAEPHAPDDVVQERDLLRMLVDSIPDYLYIKDLESRFVLGNLALARSFGADSETAVVGKRDADFAPPELEAQYRADELAVMSTGEPMVDHEELVVEASGERVWVSTTKIPLRDVRGRVIGLVGVGHNPHPVSRGDRSKRGSAEDTAREAGVSVATVSRAFNGSPRVTEETRKRIFEAARKVGYHPNAAARSLSKGHTETVALVLNSAQVSHELYAEMLVGIYASVQRCGYEVLVSLVDNTEQAGARLDEIMSGQKCAAVAVQAELLGKDELVMLSNSSIPVLLLNYVPLADTQLPGVASVGFDYRSGLRFVVRHLVALGHRQIAFLDEHGSENSQLRFDGYQAGMAECGLEIQPEWIRWIEPSSTPLITIDPIEAGAAAANSMMAELMPRPTALICGSDEVAAGAARAAAAWGQQIPTELSITGFGDATWAKLLSPALTTVALRGRDMGIAAGQLLVAHAKDATRPAASVLLPPKLVVRASTAVTPVAIGASA